MVDKRRERLESMLPNGRQEERGRVESMFPNGRQEERECRDEGG